MTEPIVQVTSHKTRIVGVVYLLFFLIAALGSVFTPKTLNNIAAQESSVWLGFAFNLLSLALYIALTALFYRLFKPVNPTIAFLATLFSVMGCTIQAFGSLFQVVPLVALANGSVLNGFTAEQSQSLAQLFPEVYVRADSIGLGFFGFFNLLIGYLIIRSTFVPRILGALMALSGVGWLIFLYPPLVNYLRLYIELVGIIAEGALMLWLLVRGVNFE